LNVIFIFRPDFPADHQALAFKGRKLLDNMTVGYYNLDKASLVYLISPTPNISVVVKSPEGKKIPFEVNNAETVLSLKQKIEEKEGVTNK
jgi:predicted RND superfamily exporter protein